MSLHGRWVTPAAVYAAEAEGWQASIGNLDFAAPQDWMCEPLMLARTGLTVGEHQRLTVANLLHLRTLAPAVPWLPVLQGWTIDDYLHCVRLYEAAGVDLAAEPRVGLGSVCRRQATGEIDELVRTLAATGLSLHGFGVKVGGLRRCGRWLASSDSMAWSRQARYRPPLPGCTHRTCNHCLRFALAWRERLLARLPSHYQATLPF